MNPLCGGDEAADRAGNAIGEVKPEPHRRQKDEKGDHDEDNHEGDLDSVALFLDALVVAHRRLNLSRVIDDLRLQGSRDIEIDVGEASKLDQRSRTFAVGRQDRKLAVPRRVHRPLGQGFQLDGEAQVVARQDVPVAAEHDRFGQ